jgi:phosphoglycerate dehydrogenase-like enzyme
MPRVAVLSDYQNVALASADWSAVTALAEVEVFNEPFADEDDAAERLQGHEVLCIMRERLPITRTLLGRLPDLRCIVTTGAANRAIDLAAASDHGVVVSGTTNGLGRVATAELAWALVLAAARSIPQEDRAVREGRWQISVGTTLRGLTLGIVGLGGVGRYVARYAKAFDMNVIAWSKNLTQERALESAVTAVSKEELLAQSDVVTIHTVLSDETTGLIDAEALARMKSTAILVNTSRGPIVNEGDLVAALRDGTIASAALDAFDVEPLPADHPYRDLDNLILSPHLGYVTNDVYGDFFRETVNSVLAYLRGAPIRVLNGSRAGEPEGPVARQYEDLAR